MFLRLHHFLCFSNFLILATEAGLGRNGTSCYFCPQCLIKCILYRILFQRYTLLPKVVLQNNCELVYKNYWFWFMVQIRQNYAVSFWFTVHFISKPFCKHMLIDSLYMCFILYQEVKACCICYMPHFGDNTGLNEYL